MQTVLLSPHARKPPIAIGDRFGRLVVTAEDVGRRHGERLVLVRCDCGKSKEVRAGHLRSGVTTSCGCLRRERIGLASTTHGHRSGSPSPTYYTWATMIQRCINPKTKRYPSYGGRGIKVCSRWRDSFEAFLADMGPKPSPKHSIDRIDVDGDYEPGNVRWALDTEQRANRRITKRVSYRGQTMTLIDACAMAGASYDVIRNRMSRGKTFLEALES